MMWLISVIKAKGFSLSASQRGYRFRHVNASTGSTPRVTEEHKSRETKLDNAKTMCFERRSVCVQTPAHLSTRVVHRALARPPNC